MTTTTSHPSLDDQALHVYARRIVARLDDSTDALPYDISERLRASREQALARRKKQAIVHVHAEQPATVILPSGGVAMLGGWRGEGGSWWQSVLAAIPAIALVVGMIAINVAQNEYGTAEVAAVDAALLTDDLPPEAYADPGFVQFLKNGGSPQIH